MTFRMHYPEVVFNVFVGGAIICTGSKDYRSSQEAWAWFYRNVLVNFKQEARSVHMNSAAYWQDTTARTDTYVADCDAIWARRLSASAAAILGSVDRKHLDAAELAALARSASEPTRFAQLVDQAWQTRQ